MRYDYCRVLVLWGMATVGYWYCGVWLLLILCNLYPWGMATGSRVQGRQILKEGQGKTHLPIFPCSTIAFSHEMKCTACIFIV